VLDNVLTESGEERLGVNILYHALGEPIRQIARNSGYEGNDIVAEILKRGYPYGFDANTGKCIDMLKAGIIEPARLVRVTLQQAVKIMQQFLATPLS
jgi:chaperonin GroEL